MEKTLQVIEEMTRLEVAIALQTGRAKDRERVIRLLESEAVDRAALSGILKRYSLIDRLNKLEGGADEK